MKAIFLLALLVVLASAKHSYVGYFQSWSEKWADKGSDLSIAKLPEYVTVVNVAFMQPDCTYNGKNNLAGTGLDFSADGSVVKQGIQALKFTQPGTKVLISVGGATYTNWGGLNVDAIANFVNDFGFDGVDIDYEPNSGSCSVGSDGKVKCSSDAEFISIVSRIRDAVPSPKLVTIAAWSIGAYGEGDWKNAQPAGDKTGLSLNLLRSDAGKSLDGINIMSYDAGTDYNPKQAFDAYKHYFSGQINLGVEIPPEAWGGHKLSISELTDLTNYVQQNGGSGMMIWSLQQQPNGTPSDSNPTPTMVSQKICNMYKLGECEKPIPSGNN